MPTNKFSTKNKSTKKIPEWVLRLEKEERSQRLSFDIRDIIDDIPSGYPFTSELIRRRILEIHKNKPLYKCGSPNIRDVLRRMEEKGIVNVSRSKVLLYGRNYIQYYKGELDVTKSS